MNDSRTLNLTMSFSDTPEKHDHAVSVDREGNGWTSLNAGHAHRVERWQVQPTEGHDHMLQGVSADVLRGKSPMRDGKAPAIPSRSVTQ